MNCLVLIVPVFTPRMIIFLLAPLNSSKTFKCQCFDCVEEWKLVIL